MENNNIETLENVIEAIMEIKSYSTGFEDGLVQRINEINAVVKYIRKCKLIDEEAKHDEIARVMYGCEDIVSQLMREIENRQRI